MSWSSLLLDASSNSLPSQGRRATECDFFFVEFQNMRFNIFMSFWYMEGTDNGNGQGQVWEGPAQSVPQDR